MSWLKKDPTWYDLNQIVGKKSLTSVLNGPGKSLIEGGDDPGLLFDESTIEEAIEYARQYPTHNLRGWLFQKFGI